LSDDHAWHVKPTFVAPDLALLGNTVSGQCVKVTLGEFTKDHTTVINDVSCLVDGLALEDRVVDLDDLLLRLLVALGMTDCVAVFVTISSRQ